jgi:hypothetical protein
MIREVPSKENLNKKYIKVNRSMTEACEDVSSGYYGDKDNSKYRKEARTNLNQSCVHNSHIPFRVQNMLHNEQKSC